MASVFLPVSSSTESADLERSAVFVDGRIRSMPLHLRIGIAAVEAMLIARSTTRTGRRPARLDAASLQPVVRRWKHSRLGPVRQYVRLVSSLVIFATFDQRRTRRP